MNEKYIINFSSLTTLQEQFKHNHFDFETSAFRTFVSGHIIRSEDYNIQYMADQLHKLYLRIKNSYDKIDEWLTSYINNTKGIERKLSNKSGYENMSDSSLINYMNNIKTLPTISYSYEDSFNLKKTSNNIFTTTLNTRSKVMTPTSNLSTGKNKYILRGTEQGIIIDCDKDTLNKAYYDKLAKLVVGESNRCTFTSSESDLVLDVISNSENYSNDEIVPPLSTYVDSKSSTAALNEYAKTHGQEKTNLSSTTAVFGVSTVEGVSLFGEGVYDSFLTLFASTFDSGFYIKTNGDTTNSFTEWLEDQKKYVEDLGLEFEYIDEGYYDKYCRKEAITEEIKTEHVKDTFDSFYETNDVGKSLKETSRETFEITRNLGNGIGYVAPAIATTIVTGGAGGSSMLASAMGAGVTMTSSFGSHVESALNNGADLENAKAVGAAGAFIDATQFFAGANINSLSTKIFSKVVNPFLKSFLISSTNVGFDALDGATSSFVEPFLESFYIDGYTDSNTGEYVKFDNSTSYFDKFQKIFENTGGWESVFSNSILAGILSSVSEGIDLPSKLNSSKNDVNIELKKDTTVNIKKEISNMVNNSEELKVLVTELNDIQLKNILSLDSSIINDFDYKKIINSMDTNQIKTILLNSDFDNNQLKRIIVNLDDNQLNFVKKNNLIKNISTGNSTKILNEKYIDFNKLTTSEKFEILNNCNSNTFKKIFKDNDFVNSNKDFIIEKMLQNQDTVFSHFALLGEYSDEMLNFIIANKKEILPNLSNDCLINLEIHTSKTFAKELLGEIELRINSGNLIIDRPIKDFKNPFQTQKVEEYLMFVSKIPGDLQNKIIKMMNDKLSTFDFSDYSFDFAFDKISKIQRLNLINLNEKGLLDESSVSILNKVFDENHNAIDYFNTELLNKNILEALGEEYIVDIGKYSDLSSKIVTISKNQNVFNFFTEMLENFKADDSLGQFYIKNESLINYFFENFEQLKNFDFNGVDYDDFMDYIIYNKYSFNYNGNKILMDYSTDYRERFYKKCDEIFEEKYKLSYFDKDMKDIYFQKYFSITYDEAISFKNKYGEYFSTLDLSDSNAKVIMDTIDKILEIENKDELFNLYYNQKFSFSSEEMLDIDSDIKTAYFKTYVDQLEETSKKIKTNISSTVETVIYNEKTVNIINMEDDFSFLVYSSDTGFVEDKVLKNDSYIDTWKSVNATAHGLSTSYIDSTNMGSAPVINTGVLYAFNDIKVDDIGIMAPYDLNSHICSYGFTSGNKQLYVPASDMSNSTTRVYNEVVLNRQSVKPDYIIVYSDFPESLYNNSLKAAAEWNIPIVKIDRIKLAETQVKKIESLISEFSKTNDADIIGEAINIYESNMSGYRLNTIYRADDPTNSINDEFNKSIMQIYNGIDKKIESKLDDYIVQLSQTDDKTNLKKLYEILNKVKDNYEIANTNGTKIISETTSVINIDKYIEEIKRMEV